MLELVKIKKDYVTGDMTTHALKGISITFRQSEFVSILGPSGCGKTTLLNIIGGLDRYTSGDLLIKNKSTKNYNDRDWDTYRNHSIGFVFQSYNLISHLTILENVELALTIGGVSKNKRYKLALNALKKVGLGDVAKKKPNQLSGGQMQRVAIARALVNNPEILLADEPTGALDSETSIQIMELLAEVAKDRLVIMVTHNPDLAHQYSNRIITMKDGLLIDDSNPFDGVDEVINEYKTTSNKKAKMSLKTAFTLSGRNLISKFKRTSLVVVAGSIGIIGISAVLAVSYGVKSYIGRMQDDMLSGNPIQITESAIDLTSLLSSSSDASKQSAVVQSIEDGKINIEYMIEYLSKQQQNLSGYTIKNEITEDYVQFIDEMPSKYYSAIKKTYGITPKLNIYTDVQFTGEKGKVDQVSLEEVESMYTKIIQKTEFKKFSSMISMFTDVFSSMPNNEDYLLSQYDILNSNGYIAKEENEVMLVVSKNTTLTDIFLGQLGYLTQDQFVDIIEKFVEEEEIELSPTKFTYDELINKKFVYYPNDAIYENYIEGIVPYSEETHMPCTYLGEIDDGETKAKGIPLKITAILRAKENVSYGALSTGFVVSPAFEQKIMNDAENSLINNKLNEQEEYYSDLEDAQKNKYSLYTPYTYTYQYKDEPLESNTTSAISIVNVSSSGSGGVFSDLIKEMFGDQYSIETQFETAIRSIGGNKLANKLAIYPLSFNEKHLVTSYLDDWNDRSKTIVLSDHSITPDERKDIKYTDNLEIIIKLINTMIEIVTIALVCFTSLSLVVSTVMIGIITYVSVIERIKEIGIIRSLGGRKIDVSNLFNVETFIIGASSGLFGIGVTYILCGLINLIINSFAKVGTLMILPWYFAILVVAISICLTLISGLIPASAAAHKDPVVALRSND